ncbi:MAG: transporter substrate-binding protein [Amycolatopsis sp.]|uniref:ABC transporter substrate-binding protein n=1 Tax=Amycolatopsis sp. TaxID=37632 RepID=UPI002634709E|nr:ABC transporter substrate-binding protein [Amycolatopsis sp.]MCU1679785.1 transporter substrate-binding protein [Amycolatopsis sp.]
MAGRRKRVVVGAALAAFGLLAAACSGSSGSGGAAQQGGTAVYGEDSGATPSWIFPFIDSAHNSTNTILQFEDLMYRPLYYVGLGDQPDINPDVSVAELPKFSDNNTKVVIDLKPYTWSNGEKLTPQDVVFWTNMMFAEKANFANYVPNEFPDNVKSVAATGASQVTLTFNDSYSADWILKDELTLITPMPMAWDKTSDSAAAGSGGCTADKSKCDAVYKYLFAKSKDLSTYQADPVWQVVDGPWHLTQYSSDGTLTMKPNPTYSGSAKPKLDAFKEVPTTSSAALYNELRAGKIVNIGSVDRTSLPKRDVTSSSPLPATNPLSASGYDLTPEYVWGWSYGLENYKNPTFGPVFQQLYIRQAIQATIDQETDSAVAWRGYATPAVGPIPTQPQTKYLSPNAKGAQGQGANPFDVDKAKQLLTSHGWTLQGGVMVCTSAGTAPNQCGTGIPAGQKLNPTLEYESGVPSLDETEQQFKSDASKAGIQLNLKQQPFNTVISDITSCSSQPSTCNWEMGEFGYETYSGPNPTGDGFFLPGAAANYSSVNDPKLTQLVQATLHSDASDAFNTYSDYVSQNLPGEFNAADSYKVYAYSSNLHGFAPFSPLGGLLPETWYFTK